MEHLSASWRRGFSAAKAAKAYSNGDRLGENMGSALFSGSILIAVGFNIYEKTRPNKSRDLDKTFEYSIHAEISALIKRRYNNDKNLTMYVYREIYNKGVIEPANSKPCEICVAHMRLANVKRVRYYNENKEPEELRID